MNRATASIPVGRKHIRDVLQALEQKGVTIFLNSHLLAEVELFCREVAIIQKGKLALAGTVQELTSGSGYRIEGLHVPEQLETELRARARSFAANNGSLNLLFGTREEANQAVDLLRAGGCEIESLGRTRSTLEEVFIKTVERTRTAKREAIVALIRDTFREAFARRIFWGFFGSAAHCCCS